MALEVQLHTGRYQLGVEQERRIQRHLRMIEGRLAHFPEPVAKVTLRAHEAQRRITADLRIELGPMAGELISHQAAETPEHAVRLAIEDVERQLERRLSSQRGEPTYGVPSRRLPKGLRPHPLTRGKEVAEIEPGEAIEQIEAGASASAGPPVPSRDEGVRS